MRNPIDVVKEMWHLYTYYGVKTFKIIDEMFILNQNHYSAIANELINTRLGQEINIWGYARVDTVKPDTLAMLRKAGFQWLALGIESGSKYVRDGSNKRLKFDDIKSVVSSIQNHNINVIGNYIFGLPDDTIDTMQETLDLALELNCEFANFYSAMAYPGSPLFTEAVKNNWELPSSWAAYSQHNKYAHPLPSQYCSSAEILRFRDNAFQIYFSNPKYLEMIKNKFGNEACNHIQGMLQYKLERDLLRNAA
jgi:radical SAM superfamily enzyme YgiQ (UPF0313 family)